MARTQFEIENQFFRTVFILFACLISQVNIVRSQVLINEIQASNITTISDQFGEFDDWVELYNAGSTAVSLKDFGLSDDAGKPFLFKFPDISIPAQSHLLVFASDSTVTNVSSHWATAINASDVWDYRANTSAPPDTNWRNLSFNGNWSSGTGGIGFSDGDDGTVVSTCISIYSRKTFSVSDTSKLMAAILQIDYDDAFVAYLNGVEIGRANIGTAGTRPAWNAVASSGHEALMYQGGSPDSFYVSKNILRNAIKPGTNVLAIEVHNLTSSNIDITCRPWLSFLMSDDVNYFGPLPSFFVSQGPQYLHAPFKISRTGETIYLVNPAGLVIDQKNSGALESDNSIGRRPDGSSNWCFFASASPGSSNNSSTCASGYTSNPVFSIGGGFYSTGQTLSLSTSYPGGQIRYTIDGSDVKSNSSVYSTPIRMDTTLTVRAAVFASDAIPSPAVTNTYFIGENTKLPVFSLTTDPKNLWDYNTGIFEKGPNAGTSNPYWGANFWQDWEKPITVEYFDRSKYRAFRFNSGMKITGGWSRSAPQKSLEIMLGDKYGQSKLNYPLEESVKPWLTKWDDFILHTTGNDRNQCKMRDPLMNRLLKGTNCDFLAYEPCLVFINGQNWGVYYVRENDDHHWIESNYGYDKDEVDLLKESYFYNGIEVKKGSDSAFMAMHNYAMNTSPSNPDFYNTMASMMDLENMVDYFIAETYYPNDDWMGGSNNNLKLWRPRKEGGKFRYLIYDLDFGLGYSGTVSKNMLSVARNASPHNYNSDLFKVLTNNTTYKRYFINRYADLMNTTFLPSNIEAMINLFRDSIKHDMHYQWEAWGSDSATWVSKMNSMITFVNQRPANARNIVQNEFGLNGQVTLTLQAQPAGAGRIQISTITPGTLPWSGVYFNGNPVTITAIPNPGYSFDHWRSNVVINPNNYNKSATINFTSNDVITAYFSGSSQAANVIITEINYNSSNTAEAGDWIEFKNNAAYELDMSGWKFKDEDDQHSFSFPTGTVLGAGAYIVLASDLEKFSERFPSVTNVIGDYGFDFSNGGENLRLFNHKDSMICLVYYQDQAPWPVEADGQGYTLERKNILNDPNIGSNWFKGCLGGSPGGPYSPPSLAISTSGALSICQGDSVTLQASASSGASFQWKKDFVDIQNAASASLTINSNGAYQVLVSNNGCSSISDTLQVTVSPIEQVTSSTPAQRCDSGSVQLTATGTSSLKWYDVQTGGSALHTGSTFNTPVLPQSKTYYVGATGSCAGPRQAVDAIINPVNSIPQTQDVDRCGAGDITLLASGTGSIRWYDSPAAGTLLSNGNSLTIISLQQSEVFYVEAGDQCPSSRVAVHANILAQHANPIISNVINCGPDSVHLTVADTSVLYWYDASSSGNLLHTGNSYTTPFINQTSTYFVQAGDICPSSRIPMQAVISSISPDPIVTDQHRCGPGSVTLTASSNDPLHWYDGPLGNLIYSGASFTTPSINQHSIYYVEAGDDCPSNRVAIEIFIDDVSDNPLVNDDERCGPGSLILTASATDTINWYSAPGSGLIARGNSFQTPALAQSTTYFVQAGTTCPSDLIAVHAIIENISPDPVVSDVHRCGEGSILFNVSSSDVLNWYDGVNSNPIATGNIFNIPVLRQTTTFFVQAGVSCPSAFVAVQAYIDPISAQPIVNDIENCGAASMLLNAASSDLVSWYDLPGGTLLATGNSFQSPFITTDQTYYVRAGMLCPSDYVALNVRIHDLPQPNLGIDTMLASGLSMVLDPGQGFVSYTWSDASTLSTLTVQNPGTYFVTVTDHNNCSGSDTITIIQATGIKKINGTLSIDLYPNPARSYCNLQLTGQTADSEIRLIDISGRILREVPVEKNVTAIRLDLEGIASGTYQIQYLSEKGFLSKSLVVQ